VEDRTEVAEGVPLRMEAVHTYGTDRMSTQDLLSFFREYGPTHVEWINDSSANVVFADIYTARRALENLSAEQQQRGIPKDCCEIDC